MTAIRPKARLRTAESRISVSSPGMVVVVG
jgi:hypothetical protein